VIKTAGPSVLILGAHSDIAVPLARLYAQDGYRVLLAARNVQRLEPCAADLPIRYGTEVGIHEFDILETGSHTHGAVGTHGFYPHRLVEQWDG
jgi:short-subunit dehydrogenase